MVTTLCHPITEIKRCASSLSYLAGFIMRGSPIGRFDEVGSDLVERRGATKSLSLAFEGRECQL